ncbi:MAG: hypothetical protein A2Y95_08430 [Deltaproteobacteria bacterium RBG_13_65_10]|jgi:hypothetical protein|nr:MAG: hypothetical protein A2Y95_08430 [Deltaproteobacteria bacterium RBG_13_65_10]
MTASGPVGNEAGTAERLDLGHLREEEDRMTWLRCTVDALAREIAWAPLPYEEAVVRVTRVKAAILSRFSTKGETYELVYAPRFRRLLEARFGRVPREWVLSL